MTTIHFTRQLGARALRQGSYRLCVLVAALSAGAALAQTPPQLPAPPSSPAPVVNYEYDAQGNPTKTVQAPGVSGFGFTTTGAYDALSRLSTRTDAKSGVTQLGYDGQDRVTSVTDPRSLTTQYPRNGLGDATSLGSPDTGTATHTYDAAGNLLTRTDSRGVLATTSYDALSRPTTLVFSQSGQANVSYGWTYDQTGAGFSNGIGRLTTSNFPAGSRSYQYDALGRLTSATQAIGTASLATGYGYDSAGHLVQVTYPSGRVLTISYANGVPTALLLAKNASGTPATLLSQIALQPFGGVQGWQWQMSSGPQAYARVFDTSGRLVRYPLGSVVRDLTYDAAGRIQSYTHLDATSATAVPTLDQSFSYDELGRLTAIATASASWSLGYDANGNRTAVTLNGATRNYAVSTTSNQLNALDNPARSLKFDAAGSTTSDTASYTSTYGLDNRLATLSNGTTSASYSYDDNGQRVAKTVNGVTTLFVYDQDGQLLGEYDQSGNAIQEYAWLAGMPMAVFRTDPANPTGDPLAYFIHTDHLNTPRVVVDRGGNVRWRWLAEPFGTTAPETDPSSLGAFGFNLRFPGQYADAESGLFYNWHRDYDPSTGRYAQSDPIGLDGGINTYGYVGGNPLSYIDPKGLSFLGDAGAFVGGWGGRAGGVVVGEALFPAGGGVPGAIVGGRVGAWGGRLAGEWLNGLLFSVPLEGKDEFAKQTERLRYHNICDNPPPPTGDHCQDKRNEIEWLKRCRDMRQEWDDRYWPKRHERNILDLNKSIKRLERILANSWDCQQQCK